MLMAAVVAFNVSTSVTAADGFFMTAPDPIVICLDPGHGGKECGSIGPTGVAEKTINLAISKYLKSELDTAAREKSFGNA